MAQDLKHLVSIPRVSPKARGYVNKVLDSGFHNASSPGFSARLEKQFAEKFGQEFGILHANGTATMHSALMAGTPVARINEACMPRKSAGITRLRQESHSKGAISWHTDLVVLTGRSCGPPRCGCPLLTAVLERAPSRPRRS